MFTFAPVPLTGSTIKDGAILGWVGPLQRITLAPNSTAAYSFNVTLAPHVPVSGNKPLLAFESYMDQVNPADGTGATLNDTYAYQVKCLPRRHRTTRETSSSGSARRCWSSSRSSASPAGKDDRTHRTRHRHNQRRHSPLTARSHVLRGPS